MRHEHASDSAPASLGRAFALGVALNLAVVAVETVYGLVVHSVALLADAAHNSSDVLGLVLAWLASTLAKRKPTDLHTYGLRSTTLLAALANACLLLVAVGGSLGRLSAACVHRNLPMVSSSWVWQPWASSLTAARLFYSSNTSARDVNVRAAFLHLAADAGVSFGVVIAGAVMWRTLALA